MYKELMRDELIRKLNKYQAMFKEMLTDKDHEEGTAEWLRCEIAKIEKELSNK